MWRWIYLLLFTGWLRGVAEASYLLDTTAYKTRTFRNELALGSSGTTTCTLSAIRFLPQTDGALRYLRLGVGAYQQIQQSTWNIQLWNDADGYVGTNIMTIGYSTSSPTGFQEIALDIGANGPALSAASTYWLTFSARVAQAAATGMAWFHNTTLADNLDTTEFYSYMYPRSCDGTTSVPSSGWSGVASLPQIILCDRTTPSLQICGLPPSQTPTPSATPSISASSSITPTQTRSSSRTATQTRSGSRTPTRTATRSVSATQSTTASPSTSQTQSASLTPSMSQTISSTASVSPTPSPSTSVSATESPSQTTSPSETTSPTQTSSLTPSRSETASQTPSRSETVSQTPSNSMTVSQTPSRSGTSSLTPSITPSASVTPSSLDEVLFFIEYNDVSVSPSPTIRVSRTVQSTQTAILVDFFEGASQTPDRSFVPEPDTSFIPEPDTSWNPNRVSVSPSVSASPSQTQTSSPSQSPSPSQSQSPSLTASQTPTQSQTSSTTKSPTPAHPTPPAYNCMQMSTMTITNRAVIRSNAPGTQYIDNMICRITIRAPAGLVVKFEIKEFATELNFDFLKIYNGPTGSAPLIAQYSGSAPLNSPFYSTTQDMFIQWSSDISIVSTGVVGLINFDTPLVTTQTPTRTPSSSPSATQTRSQTPSSSLSATQTRSQTPTATRSVRASYTPTRTPSKTITGTHTPTLTSAATQSPTSTISTTATASITSSPSETASHTATSTISGSASITATQSATTTQTRTISRSASQSVSASRSITASNTPSNSLTVSPSTTATPTRTVSQSSSTSPSVSTTSTSSSSQTSSRTRTVSQTGSATISSTASPSSSISATASTSPSLSRTSTASTTATPSTSKTQSMTPSSSTTESTSTTPSMTSTQTTERTPSISRTISTSMTPSSSATESLSATPTSTTSVSETASLSQTPTSTVSVSVSVSQSASASVSATASATVSASVSGSSSATASCSGSPTQTTSASARSTASASGSPTASSSASMSASATMSPSVSQSSSPSTTQTVSPTISSSSSQSSSPSYSSSATLTPTSTVSGSVSTSASPTQTSSASVSGSASASVSQTTSSTVSVSATPSPSGSKTSSASASGSASASVSGSQTISSTASVSSTQSPSTSSTSSGSVSVSASPTNTVSASVSSSQTSSGSPTQTQSPTSTISSSATQSASPSGSVTRSASLTPSPSKSGSVSATVSVTASPTTSLSQTPSPTPSPISFSDMLAGAGAATGNDTDAAAAALNNQLSSLAASGASLSPEQGQQLVSAFFATAAPPAEEDTQAATNTLNLIASLIVASGSSVKIETAAFQFAAVPAPSEITAVPVQGGSIDVPPVPGVAAMSIIAWKRPDARRRRLQEGATAQQATNMIAISALASDGTATTVQNLTEPFRLSWDAASIDTAPSNYTDGNDTIHYEPECVYLNRQLGTWETDGCHTTIAPDGSLTCACNHLTEFAARFRAIRAKNAALFAAASQLYSLEGLIKYKYYFIFFGSFIAGGAILLIVLSRIDRKAAFVYQKLLAEFDEIRFLYRTHKGRKPFIVDRVYPAAKELMHSPTSSVDDGLPMLPSHEAKLVRRSRLRRLFAAAKLLIRIWKNRIFHQHSYLSIFFRYDPRLGRTYRAIFILTTIFHSLFVSAFFYGYTHGVDEAPTIAETLFLAVLTSAINIPVLKFFYTLMNRAGTAEYKWRYPYIFTELKRRHDFEAALQNVQLGGIDEEIHRLMREMGRDISVESSRDTASTTDSEQAAIEIQGADMAATATQDDSVETYLLLVLGRLCCRRKRNSGGPATGLLVAKSIASQLDPEFHTPNCISRNAPFHTAAGAIAYFVPIGWFIWCINYLLLFAASNSDDDSLYVFKSYGISQLTSLLLVNPLTILIGLVIGLSVFLIKQKCGKQGVVTPGHPIQVLSDPLYKPGATTSLSAKFGYWLFLKAPAEVSLRAPGVVEMDIACATPAAVNGHIQEIIRGSSPTMQDLKAVGGENNRDATISMLYYLYRGIALGCE